MNIRRSNQGFTLIELLVVITIIMLMTGLIMTNYITFAERNRVRTASEEAQNFLSDIQNRARMGHRGDPVSAVDPGCTITFAQQALDRPLIGWWVEFRNNAMRALPMCEVPYPMAGAPMIHTFGADVIRYLPQNSSFVFNDDDPLIIIFPALYGNPTDMFGNPIDVEIITVDTNRQGEPLRNHFYSFNISAGGAISSGSFCEMNEDWSVCEPIFRLLGY